MILASLNRHSEDIRIETVVVAELKFSDVQRHVLLADLVEGADNAALDDRPEALNRVRVNCADDVFALGVVDSGVRITVHAETMITDPLVGAEQANPVRDGFVDERFQRRGFDVRDHARDDIALTADSTSDDRPLAASGRTGQAVALVSMFVLGLAADESFINLDDATKLRLGFDQRSADFVAHGMRRAVATEAHDALNLKGADSLLAGQHQMSDAIPVTQRLIGVLKDRARHVREAITVLCAHLALPVMAGRQRITFAVAAARTSNALGPAPRDQIGNAGGFIRKHRLELSDGHLVNRLRTTRHGIPPFVGGYCHAK